MLYHLIPFRGRDGPRRNADRAQTAVAADRRGTAALILSKGRLMDERIAPLFSLFALRSLRLAKRIVMAPMTRRFSPNGIPGADVAAYYAPRAETGLKTTERTEERRVGNEGGRKGGEKG